MGESPRRTAAVVRAEYEQTLRESTKYGWDVKCRTDPIDKRFTSESDADLQEAAAACFGCPFFDLCGEYAAIDKPWWGVLAGKVWKLRKVVFTAARPAPEQIAA